MTTFNSDKNRGHWQEVEDFYRLSNNLENNNMNGILTLSWINIKSALVYGLIALILYVISTGSVFGLDWHILVNTAVMAILTSFVKNFFTNNDGKFANVVEVVDAPAK